MVSSEELAFLDEARAWLRSGGAVDALVSTQPGPPSTRLHCAARRGYCSAVRWLLENGADVKAVGNYTGSTPLHVAASNDRCDAAVLLLDAGAHVGSRTRELNTALHWAADAQSVRMCKLLLSRGASLDALNSSDRDPEARARFYFRPDTAAFLADVRAAGGWAAYVAAPRNQLLALRRELPTRSYTAPCRARAQARLFLDPKIPDDVFMHVLTFWRSARDSAY
jgi:ankyrin